MDYRFKHLKEIERVLVTRKAENSNESNAKEKDPEKELLIEKTKLSLQKRCRHYDQDDVIEIMELLLNKLDTHCLAQAINSRTPDVGYTPLHCLCQFYRHDNFVEIVRYFISSGFNVNAHGATAAKLLIDHYPDGNKKLAILQLLK